MLVYTLHGVRVNYGVMGIGDRYRYRYQGYVSWNMHPYFLVAWVNYFISLSVVLQHHQSLVIHSALSLKCLLDLASHKSHPSSSYFNFIMSILIVFIRLVENELEFS